MSFSMLTLEQAISDAINNTVPDVPVQTYPRRAIHLNVPCVLVLCDSFEPMDSDGTERLILKSKWLAYTVVADHAPNADTTARMLAISVAKAVDDIEGKSSQGYSKASLVGIFEDSFNPDLDGFLVWKVEFDIPIKIGENVWDGTGITPTQVLVAFGEDIGAAENYEPTI
jgi:hypothetical protein